MINVFAHINITKKCTTAKKFKAEFCIKEGYSSLKNIDLDKQELNPHKTAECLHSYSMILYFRAINKQLSGTCDKNMYLNNFKIFSEVQKCQTINYLIFVFVKYLMASFARQMEWNVITVGEIKWYLGSQLIHILESFQLNKCKIPFFNVIYLFTLCIKFVPNTYNCTKRSSEERRQRLK